jgi:hypothetical protein
MRKEEEEEEEAVPAQAWASTSPLGDPAAGPLASPVAVPLGSAGARAFWHLCSFKCWHPQGFFVLSYGIPAWHMHNSLGPIQYQGATHRVFGCNDEKSPTAMRRSVTPENRQPGGL